MVATGVAHNKNSLENFCIDFVERHSNPIELLCVRKSCAFVLHELHSRHKTGYKRRPIMCLGNFDENTQAEPKRAEPTNGREKPGCEIPNACR